jgi:hypothetical protein
MKLRTNFEQRLYCRLPGLNAALKELDKPEGLVGRRVLLDGQYPADHVDLFNAGVNVI